MWQLLLALSVATAVASPLGGIGLSETEHETHKAAVRSLQQAAHTPERSPYGDIKCGTIIPDVEHDMDHVHEGSRGLAKRDCSMSQTNPLDEYSPTSGPVYRVKTVVHVISSGTDGAIPQSCVNTGIAWLNRDFRATSGSKAAGSVDTRIEFVLSQVRYHDNAAWQNQAHSTSGGFWTAADVSNYMNIFIKTPPGGILGQANLAQFAGGYSGVDGITVGRAVWGDCATSTMYHQGATATHEVGHYLGLLHTFNQNTCPSGDVNSGNPKGCNSWGDLTCDTEPEAGPIYDCASRGTCGAADPISNFMGYSHDSCLTKFTEEQARRMRCSLTSYRPNVFTAVSGGYRAPPPAAAASPPPPLASPPASTCTCRDVWATNLGGTTYHVNGCDNPGNLDPVGTWCASNEGAGCRSPTTGVPTSSWWFYCVAAESPPPCRARAWSAGPSRASSSPAAATPTTTAAARGARLPRAAAA